MKVILLVCVLTIARISYGQKVVRVVSAEMEKKKIEVTKDKKTGEESLQEEELYSRENDLFKLNHNDTHKVKLDDDFAVQEGTKLGRIVVPDLPQEEVDLEYQSENIAEVKENATTSMLIIANENNTLSEDEIVTTVANLEEEIETNTLIMKLESQSQEKNDKSLYSELEDTLETTTELPSTVMPERKPSKELNKTLEVSHTTQVTKKNFTTKTFPTLDFEMTKRVYKVDQDNAVKRLLPDDTRLKKLERRTFSSWNFLDLGEEKHGSVLKIIKEVPYPVPYPVEKKVPFPVKVEVNRPIPIEVPKPYPVTFEKNVFFPIREYIHTPYPVYRKLPYFIQISVDKPVPFHIPRPYPVFIEKKVPYPVEKQIPIPINIPVDRPTPVHFPFVRSIYYPVEKKVHYPVHIPMEKPVAVSVEKPYPVYVEKRVPEGEHFSCQTHVEENKTQGEISQNYSFQKDIKAESFLEHKTEHFETPQLVVNNGGFIPLTLSTSNYNHISFQKKNDNEPQESEQEILQKEMTTQLPLKKETTTEGNTTKTYHDFGKKIKNS